MVRAFLSLGAGVQSTTLYLMACAGELGDKPEAAIFADTQWEPKGVYRHLDWLESLGLSVPIVRVTAGNIRDLAVDPQGMPFFIGKFDGSRRGASLKRECTVDYKINPIRKYLRSLRAGREHLALWLGISLDEVGRMKPSRVPWIEHRWPLIDRRLSRANCLAWLERQGYPAPPKSACKGCPYHSNRQWVDLRDNQPADWADAVAFDREIRESQTRFRGPIYLHQSCLPLDQAPIDVETLGQGDLFLNECEGHCGL